jgi:LysM repeat protein
MTANDLADLLYSQAVGAPHQLELSDATLGTTGLDDLIKSDLRRDAPLLLIVDPAIIPTKDTPSAGFTIPVNVPSGADGFLSLDGRDATLQFLVVGTKIDLVLTVSTTTAGGKPVPWVFSTSFPELAFLPYDQLPLEAPSLTLSTGAAGTPAKGLDFAGTLELTGIFQAVAKLLHLSDGYALTGQIAGSGDDMSFDLQAPFNMGQPPPTIGGMVTLKDAGAGVALTPVKHNGTPSQETDLYLYGEVDLTNLSGGTPHSLPLDLKASMPLAYPDSPMLVLLIDSPPGFQTDIKTLGELIGGQTFADFFDGPAKVILDPLNQFALKSYMVTFALGAPPSPMSMTLDIGTLSPFSMWNGGPTVDVDILWNVIWISGTSKSSVTLTADFAYPPQSGPAPKPKVLDLELIIDSDLNFTGRQKGKLPPLSLGDVNDKLLGGNIPLPGDLITVQVADITLSAALGVSKQFTLGATVSADIKLFGAEVLGIRNMAMSVSYDAGTGAASSYTGTIDGEVFLGPITFQTDATVSNDPNVDTVFTLHLVDETLGSMLNHIVHIVDPTYDVSFGDPWDKILDISLDAFVLKVNLTKGKGSVELDYEPANPIDLAFLTIKKVGLTYTEASKGKASSTKIDVAGTFFGIDFPSGDNALTWDPVNEAPPAVPGKGSKIFDLEYAGIGQHIGLGGSPTTMDEVMTKLRATASPTEPGALPPFGTDLVFKGDSSWLIGAQFSVMDTVSIKAIFNDPDLYGVVIELSGEKAKIFAGLRFEILYRKVTETIGVYHIELKLPDAMRHLEFGEVSVTLPVVDLDIYTNGNFRVDFGFPKGLDFSNSFSLQVFPFVGFGGFYFALLDGATSTRVPQITNGNWSPVIEFGVALSVGVGKDIDEGILKGGISVTIVGILEGVLAWFHPTDSAPAETYYWFKGTIAVTGKLYATIDFAIIQASVDVTAYISATLVIESHQPIHIEATASVSVRVSVKIVFFTIHLSFDATVDASFTIGSASPTPWIVKSGGAASDGEQRLMTGQRTLHASPMLVHPAMRKSVRRALVAAQAAPPLTDWPAVCVFPHQQVQNVTIHALPAFTKAQSWAIATVARASGTVTVTTTTAHDLDSGDPVALAGVADGSFDGAFTVTGVGSPTSFTFAQGANDGSSSGGTATAANEAGSGDVVMLLTAESSVPPDAKTLSEHRMLQGDDPASKPFNLLMQAMLGWGIYAETHRSIAAGSGAARAGGTVTITTRAPHGFPDGVTVTVAGVADGSFDGAFIATVPTATTFTYAQAGADATSGGGVASIDLVTADQLEDLRQQLSQPDTVAAAFDYTTLTEFLAANFTFDVEQAVTSTGTAAALFPMFPAIGLSDTAGNSVPSFSLPATVDSNYVAKIRAYFQLLQVQFAAASGNQQGVGADVDDGGPVSMATVLFTQYFNMLMSTAAKAAVDLLASYPYTRTAAKSIQAIGEDLNDGSLVSDPLRVVTPNQDAAVLAAGALIYLPDVVHQVRSGETFAGIAATLAANGAQGAKGPYAVADLLAANQDAAVFDTGVALPLAGLPYTSVSGDTVNLIATRVLVRAASHAVLTLVTGMAKELEALVTSSGVKDPNARLDAGTVVKLPEGTTYTALAGDTLTLLAAYRLAPAQNLVDVPTYAAALQALNPSLPSEPTQPVTAGTQVLLAALSRPLAAGDTIATLAETLMTTADAIGAALVALPTPVLSPQAVLHTSLHYEVAPTDTLSSIATKLDLTLDYLAGQLAVPGAPAVFAANKTITVSDLTAIDPATLANGLVTNAEWNNAAGMVSRFLLSGIRLPDPSDPKFAALTPKELLDPANLVGVRTKPAFELTRQQYPLGTAVPGNYAVTLSNAGSMAGLTLGGAGSQSVTLTLSSDEQQLFSTIATTPLAPGIETLSRLALFRMAPPRIVLQKHVAWQAALPPAGCFPAGSAAGNPTVWMFPDSLVTELEKTASANSGSLPYEVVTAKHVQADQPVVTSEAGCSAWATLVNFTVSLPETDGPAASTTNAYVVEGADDTGAELLQQVYQHLTTTSDSATLYLLYPPDPAANNSSGLASDVLDPAATYLLKTNLSTLTHSSSHELLGFQAAPDPTSVYAASLSDPADFIAVLWEASITRSGGFYLEYVNANGGAALPSTVFGTSATAQLSLVVVLESQAGLWPIQPVAGAGALRKANTVTISTSCVHGLAPGDTVTVAGVADTSFNGTFKVATVPGPGSFTYAQTGADGPSGGGTANEGASPATVAGLLPFNNCAVVGENVDPTVTSVFVQPATHAVQEGDTLQTIASAYDGRWGTGLAPADVATLNAAVPQLLAVGATLTVPNQPGYEVQYGDTFDTVVATLAAQGITTTAADLGTANAGSATILSAGAQVQFALGVLQPATVVPPGVVGFEITRTNPDSTTIQTPDPVSALFNLVGWSVTGEGAFTASGAGLPTTPADRLLTQANGITRLDADDTSDTNWYYQQTLVISPFGGPAHGSASKALPLATGNPYNGIGAGGALGDVTIGLWLLDVYGNAQPLSQDGSLAVPVGYYDDLSGPVSWPSLGMSYLVTGSPPVVSLSMTMQQARYIPSASVPVPSALAAIAADLQSYTSIYYQLAQPDVGFSLETTLALGDDGKTPVTYPLPKAPFASFANGAYIYLQALSTMTAVKVAPGAGGTTVEALVGGYGVTAPQLFAANQTQLYSSLFGAAQIAVPQMYSVLQGDSLDSIAAHWKPEYADITAASLAGANANVPLNPGVQLTANTRTATATPPPDAPPNTPVTLDHAATLAHTSSVDIATSNAATTGLLAEGAVLTLGTKSYTLGPKDTFANAATQLDATVDQVALANRFVPVFIENAPLTVKAVLVSAGDTLPSLAAIAGVGTVDQLVTLNEGLQNIFAPATSLLIGASTKPSPSQPSDTLASFAARNSVALDQLALANAGGKRATATFVEGASVEIPNAIDNGSAAQHCTYTDPGGATPQSVADLFGTTATAISALNPEPPAAGGLWIAPPMRGDAYGHNSGGSFSGLAKAYNTDATALATANAAALGVLATGKTVTVAGTAYTTQQNDTLNSLVNRLAAAQPAVTATLADVIAAALDVPGLVEPTAQMVPVPPPSPANSVQITPKIGSAVFQIAVNVIESRARNLVDPDFTGAPTVVRSTLAVPPDPDPTSTATTLSLSHFAKLLQTAIPGLNVATGDPAAEDDPANAATIWGVNFGGPPELGPSISYSFVPAGSSYTYFAVPPLSPSLMSGDVGTIIPYVSGQEPPFSGTAETKTFRGVDLDAWLDDFLRAVDLFLSPAFAVPAYALSPKATLAVVQAKQELAQAISKRLLPVLEGSAGDPTAAIDALYQSMLTQLSTAFTVDTVVQVPVTVTSTDTGAAPRLSGKVDELTASGDVTALPQAYSFSTAKVPLLNGSSSATFLFTVKAPADHREVKLDLEYAVTELELPDPTEKIGDYQGSYWLKFVLPIERSSSAMKGLDIPVPLRAYPGPVTLAAQTASQSFDKPDSADELLPWDFSFVYQHDDAEQDTPLVEVAFNTTPSAPWASAGLSSAVLTAVFDALAQFTTAYATLKNDLALLTTVTPGTVNPTLTSAVEAFSILVTGVAGAFKATTLAAGEFDPPPQTFYYQLQKEADFTTDPPSLTSLVITSVHPTQGPANSDPAPVWPAKIVATWAGEPVTLELQGSSTSQRTYAYPKGLIPADAQFPQTFLFDWPGATECKNLPAPPTPGVAATLEGAQTFQFQCVNVLGQQSARAGVSIWRNLELVENQTTTGDFIYRTPVTSFTSSAVPSVAAANPIPIGTAPTPIGEALGSFLKEMLDSQNAWKEGETLAMRFGGGYSYELASSGKDVLSPVVPIFLVASVEFDPLADWDSKNSTSFVSQVEAVVMDWLKTNSPRTQDASVVFDMTIYASGGQLQPLIHATSLGYALSTTQ